MGTILQFEELEVWKKARHFNKRVFELISTEIFGRDYSILNQINRSAASIMDNIAEGFGRKTKGEFIQYLFISKGSCQECKSQIYRAEDRGYISRQIADELKGFLVEILKMINSLITFLRNELKSQSNR